MEQQIDFSTMTLDEINQLIMLANKHKDVVKKDEQPILKFIEEIKKAKISNTLLTRYLLNENLLDLSIIEKTDNKTIIATFDIKTETGRDGTFKIWLKDKKPRTPWLEPISGTKHNWAQVKNLNIDKFLERFNDDGKKWLETDDGKKWFNEVKKQLA